MHCCSGIAKQVTTQCFGNKQKTELFPKNKINEVDKLTSKSKADYLGSYLKKSFRKLESGKTGLYFLVCQYSKKFHQKTARCTGLFS